MRISKLSDPLDLTEVATRLRSSSNFRFAWQFYQIADAPEKMVDACRSLLENVVVYPELHEFLRTTNNGVYRHEFKMWHVAEPCEVRECTADFTDTFASAVFDHLGAYSNILRPATQHERKYVEGIFSRMGDFVAYSLFECDATTSPRYCRGPLFSSWFYDVGCDYAYFVAWPQRNIIWLGCLTDTD